MTMAKILCCFVKYKGILSQILGTIFYIKIILFTLEPVGAKRPSFSNEGTGILFTFTKNQGTNVVLLCPAQAFPVPKFR